MEEIQSYWAEVYHCADFHIWGVPVAGEIGQNTSLLPPLKIYPYHTSTDKSATSEDFESALDTFGHLFTCLFCPLSWTSLPGSTCTDTVFCLLSVPISPVPSKAERPQSVEEERTGWKKQAAGRKKRCDDFSKTHLTEIDLLVASGASYNICMCSIRHTAISNTSRSSSRFWSGHSLPPLA